jgi:hypothetical protein
MAWTTKKTAVAAGVIIVLAAGTTIMLVKKSGASGSQRPPWPHPVPSSEQIRQASVGAPDLQIQAKMLVFGAMALKRIPDAANWCDTLNRGGTLWPVTPTNTVFALNSQLAGRTFSRTMRGDTVLFFEASKPGWNQAGGPELLAKNADGVVVAFLDGRALIVPAGQVAQLRWTP